MGMSLTAVPYVVARSFRGELIELSDEQYIKHLGEQFTPDELLSNANDDFAVTYELSDNNRLYITYLQDHKNHFAVLQH